MSDEVTVVVDDRFDVAVIGNSSVIAHTHPLSQISDMTASARTLAQLQVNAGLADYREVDSVIDLINDTSLTYTAGSGNSVAAGTVIRTRGEGFSYIVASSAATDHDLSTTGNIKLYVQPFHGAFHIDAFGAIGNGANDDTAAFNAFRLRAIATGTAVTLNFSAGKTYMVANPYWPCDIPELTVNGNGSSLKNNATENKDKMLLCPAYGMDKDGLGTFYNPVDFYLIATTTVGASTATTLTASDAGNFSVGEYVMLGSWDIQWGGYPFNARYFEYKEITGVDAGTGVITFRDPVRYAHQQNFPYIVQTPTEYGNGRANIYKIEQGSKWNINHTYNDITFVKNDVDAAGACVQAAYLTGRSVTMNRCVARWFLPHVAETAAMNFCKAMEKGELDKLVTNFEATDCDFFALVGEATSINNFRAIRTKFHAGYNMNPRNIELIDCNVTASTNNDVFLRGSYNPVESLRIRGGTHKYLPIFTLQSGGENYVDIGVGSVTWTASTSTLTVPLDTTQKKNFAARLFPGAVIVTTVSFAGGDYFNNNYGIVRSVTGDVTNCYAVIDFASLPAGTERLASYGEPRYTDIQVEGNIRDYVRFAHTLFQRRNLLVTSAYSSQSIPVCGRPRRVIVDVKRVYSGATAGNITFNVRNGGAAAGGILSLQVDLKTLGRRERTMSANSGWTGAAGETAAGNLATGVFSSNAFGLLNLTASTMASTGDDQLPIVDTYIEFESPYNRY